MSDQKFIYLISSVNPEAPEDPIDRGYFSTRELAEQAMAERADEDWVEILEIPLDLMLDEGDEETVVVEDAPPKTVYRASRSIIYHPRIDQQTYEDRSGAIRPGGFLVSICDRYGGYSDRVTVESEVSMEHALKVLDEARRKYIVDHKDTLPYKPDWHLENRFAEGTV